MKIATITCQHVYNYGATLQAFALQHYLESIGNDVEIISYRPSYQHRYDINYIDERRKAYKLFHGYKPLLRLVAHYWVNRDMPQMFPRRNAFDAFDTKYLHLTTTHYYNIRDLRSNSPQADTYVAGSDQIWNTETHNGQDPAYYLDFGNAKKISYAASFATSNLSENWKPFVKYHLSHFSAVSVREKTGLKILESLGIKGVEVVDPVFLLTAEEWIKALDLTPTSGKYIFLYDFLHDNEDMRHMALDLKQQTGLPLISVNDYRPTNYADININDAGPREFLRYLLGAHYVICASFHATAFSLIFHKPFATWPLMKQNNASRMIDLLESMGLLEHYRPKETVTFSNINWKMVDEKLRKYSETSKKWLISRI